MDCARIVDAVQSTAVACQWKKVMRAQIESRPGTLHATIAPRSSRNSRARWRARFVVLALVGLSAGAALGQATNQIAAINPNSAAQGTTGPLVTFALDTDSPPAPAGRRHAVECSDRQHQRRAFEARRERRNYRTLILRHKLNACGLKDGPLYCVIRSVGEVTPARSSAA